MFDKKVINYLVAISPFIEMYKDGCITDAEFEEAEEKVAKKCGINPMSIYRYTLKEVKGKLLK